MVDVKFYSENFPLNYIACYQVVCKFLVSYHSGKFQPANGLQIATKALHSKEAQPNYHLGRNTR